MLSERKEVWEQNKENKEVVYGWKYKTEKQYKEEYDFLKEVDSISLVQSRRHLENAYNNFFKSISGKRKGGELGFPQFKKKKNGESYSTQKNAENIRILDNKHIKLPKLGIIKFSQKPNKKDGVIKSATITKTPTGNIIVQYYSNKKLKNNQK